MATLSKDKVFEIINNRPKNTTPEQVVEGLISRGHSIEGLSIPGQQKPNLIEKAGDVLTTFGGAKIGEAIGTQIAKATVPEEQKQFVEPGPTGTEVAGDVLRVGSLFAPIGRLAGAAAKGISALGIGGRSANIAGNVLAGGGTGLASDVGVALSEEGDQPIFGLGSAIGAGIPIASPIAGALAKATAKLSGRVGSEIQGALTGTSAETIQKAFEASKTGGKELESFTSALRGKTTPEQITNIARANVENISKRQQELFKNTLEELSDIQVSSAPAKQLFQQELVDTGISITDNGLLDFTNSKLRTVPNAQSKLQQAWNEIKNMPDNLTLGELDTTRQAIKGIKSIAGDEPSANLANMLIDDAVRSVRTAGENVEGYGKMLDNFGETSEFLDQIQKGLSLGDQATIDQAYRRLATTLKTNNEQRMALVKELDKATGGSLLSTIAGQQLSEDLPRGIIRAFSASLAVSGAGAIATGLTGLGYGLVPLVLASPRVSGEIIRALGIGARKTDIIVETIGDLRNILLKAGIITAGKQNAEDNNQQE